MVQMSFNQKLHTNSGSNLMEIIIKKFQLKEDLAFIHGKE